MSKPGDRPRLETGVYSRDVDTQRLKKLDLDDLSIAETGRHPRPPGLTDPNDNSSTTGGNVGNTLHGANPAALNPDPAETWGRKPLDPQLLEEWLALRHRAEPDPDESGG